MTVLVWDQVGDRRYETGIDRGVLYPIGIGESAVPWNGLTAITENRTREIKSYYLDGIKFLNHQIPDTYTAKVQAFTYPEVLERLIGSPDIFPGITAYDQPARVFNLSYRTRIGDDLSGVDHGYKIHLIYNVMAAPDDVDFETLGESVAVKPFSWVLNGTPAQPPGTNPIRPTSHMSLNSTSIDPLSLQQLEAILYGTDDKNASFPSLVDLLQMYG
jgi:hypothetical protein